MEALAAFFVESTFLGLWIFGWDQLPKKVHLATIWAVALSTNLSAFFILAANSWMQHPVGAVWNEATGRAEMNDIGAVLTNSTLWAAFPHTITAAFVTAGTFVAGISAWWMVRLVRAGQVEKARDVYRPAVVLGVIVDVRRGRRRRTDRRPAGQADVPAAAHEDVVGRGPVRDRGRRVVLPAGHRRPEQLVRGRHARHRDPRPHVVPGHRRLERTAAGCPGPAEAVRGEVRVHRRRRQLRSRTSRTSRSPTGRSGS